jgi:hypothetical protein
LPLAWNNRPKKRGRAQFIGIYNSRQGRLDEMPPIFSIFSMLCMIPRSECLVVLYDYPGREEEYDRFYPMHHP